MEKLSITVELEKVPKFTGTNVTKFLYQALYIFETFSMKVPTEDIVPLLATKFKFEDFQKLTKEKFETFDDFAEFVISLGKADVSKEDVLEEIKNMRQYRGESLQKYLCRISTLMVEYTLAVDAEDGESEYTPEEFENLLAKSAIAGLDPKHRKKARGLTLQKLYEFLRGKQCEKASTSKLEVSEERWVAREKMKLASSKWTVPTKKFSSLEIVEEENL